MGIDFGISMTRTHSVALITVSTRDDRNVRGKCRHFFILYSVIQK